MLFHDKAVGAMLGAAYGDALGWPNERNHNLSSRNSPANPKLKTWVKKCGGRYSPVAPFGNNSQRETFSFYDYDSNAVEVFSQKRIPGKAP